MKARRRTTATLLAVHDRQLGTLKEFFKLLDDEGASLRLVKGDSDLELDSAAVSRARHRVEGLRIEDRNEAFEGQIVNWTPYSHRFEPPLHDGGALLPGTVAREAMDRANQEGPHPFNQHFRLSLKVREARARNRPPKKLYTLLKMEPVDAPESLPASRQQAL
ncbi:MAG: hypothetical protein H7337_11410 [Rhizobacter sp.]|nr:hypothetical protein [Rhizobacter sp.]